MDCNYTSLTGAYGDADKLSAIINGLWSDNVDDQEEAINEGLWGWSCHQYTMYSVTPFVLRDIVQNIECIRANPSDIICFIRLCLELGNSKLKIDAIESSKLRLNGLTKPDMREIISINKDSIFHYIWSNHLATDDAYFVINKCS